MGNPPHSPLSHLSHTLIMAVEQKQEEETPMTRMQMIITGAGALVAAPILLFLFAWMVAQCHAKKLSDGSKLSWKKVIVPLLACGCTKRDGTDLEMAEVSTKKVMMYSIMMYFFAVVGAFVLIMALTSSDEEESENKDVEAGKSPEV